MSEILRGPAPLRVDAARRGSKNYSAFMRASDATAVVAAVEECFSSWLESKGLGAHGDTGEWSSEGKAASLQRAQDGDQAVLRARLIESDQATGTWTTDLLASDAGWIHLAVRNAEGRMVAVPRLAKSLMASLDLSDASLQLKNDVKLWDVGELDQLVDLLQDRDRHGLVLVAGTGPDPGLFQAFRERIPKWTREVYGLAQSIVLTPQATYALGERLHFHAVAPWTVRTYYPGLDPSSAVDSRRHRYLTTATLANESDGRLRSLLANVARLQASQRPEPAEAVHVRRVLERDETRRLLEHLQRQPEAQSAAVDPIVEPSAEPVTTSQVADAPPSAKTDLSETQLEARPELVHGLALLGGRLGLSTVTPETVTEAVERLLVLRGELTEQVQRASLRIKEQSAKSEELEDKLRLAANLLDDDSLEQASLQQELDGARSESQWLRDRLRSLEDYEGAVAQPDVAATDYPTSCLEVVERLEDLAAGVIVFTGDVDDVSAVDEVDVLQLAARTAWDSCISLKEYARAKAAGACSNGVDHYLRHRPSGYDGISPGKHGMTETGVTMRRFGSERSFPVPSSVDATGRKTMTAHFKLARIGMFSPRLYYFDDLPASGKIYLGYLGRHLTNTQSN
ncbi:hypothetical protein BA895_05290 [Humibacillus sp. DSM 29435]|uniref:hypothetical protein n=1 Tax=Humibacillus sp. DSM 29435 TaxID=1869167 RepID=UPI0008720086|nr:hypothetical protein [Humibacillus sp. DSM 29435]OFE15916.1 hypothetical protein BA895_05290 [Humibacillus sp. DSM 29435]